VAFLFDTDAISELLAWTGWQVILAVEGFYLASLPWLSRQVTHSVIPIGAVLFIVAELLSAGEEIMDEPAAAPERTEPERVDQARSEPEREPVKETVP
jgi:TRAP-type C4-dicarboxylate transport system permease small subunit